MKKLVIDFTGAIYYGDLHKIIKDSFKKSEVEGFPDFYGENLAALWDCLTGFIETPIEITIKGSKTVGKDAMLGIEDIIEVFREAEEEKSGASLSMCWIEVCDFIKQIKDEW